MADAVVSLGTIVKCGFMKIKMKPIESGTLFVQ